MLSSTVEVGQAVLGPPGFSAAWRTRNELFLNLNLGKIAALRQNSISAAALACATFSSDAPNACVSKSEA
jgi:hypothetical protein